MIECSARHGKFCSAWHHNLVSTYRDERYRQERMFEDATGHYRGDMALARENGHRMVTFADWLRSNRVR